MGDHTNGYSKPIPVATRAGSSVTNQQINTPSSVSLSFVGSFAPSVMSTPHNQSAADLDSDNLETRSMLSFTSDLDKQEDSMALMVRKLAVLKKGLMNERTLRREAEDREKLMQSQLGEAQRRAKEKEQLANQLAQKNKELMLRLADADHHTDLISPQEKDIDDALKKKSRKEIETENKQLSLEVKRLSDLLKAVHTGEHEYTTQQLMQARMDRDEIERRLQQALEEAQRANDKAALETKSVMDMNYALLAEQKSLEERLASATARLRAADRTISEKEITLQTQGAEVDHLKQNQEEQKMVMKQMAKKMVLLKTKVQALELPLKHYNVTMPSRMGSQRQAEIQISKNPTTHDLMLCVTCSNHFDMYTMNDILSVSVNDAAHPSPTSGSTLLNRFWIYVEGRHANDPLVFESAEASTIVSDIKQYMGMACENSRDSILQHQSRQQKNAKKNAS